jgi:hypothetical protein
MFMAEKKLIIGAKEMTQVIYIGSNLNAEGGKKRKQSVTWKINGLTLPMTY